MGKVHIAQAVETRIVRPWQLRRGDLIHLAKLSRLEVAKIVKLDKEHWLIYTTCDRFPSGIRCPRHYQFKITPRD